jgi:sugar/nucleoside kinase (ribokinase family)
MVEPVRSAARHAAAVARANGARISVDLASWSAIRDSGVGAFVDAVRAVRPDVVFANEDEERVVPRSAIDAVWILKRGERGCCFDGVERAALPANALDSTGAGDALAAGWILGGPELGLEAAARCVEQIGAMPVASST